MASTPTTTSTGITHAGRFDSESTTPRRFVVELPDQASFDEACSPSENPLRRVRVRSESRRAGVGIDSAKGGPPVGATTLSFISVTGRCMSRSTVCSA